MTDRGDLGEIFRAAIHVREANYRVLRHAMAALLYVRNKQLATGATGQELAPIHAEVGHAKLELAQRYGELQALKREALRASAVMSVADAHVRCAANRRAHAEEDLESARDHIEQLTADRALSRELEI